MKKYLFILTISILSTFTLHAQKDPVEIIEIRKEYQKIENGEYNGEIEIIRFGDPMFEGASGEIHVNKNTKEVILVKEEVIHDFYSSTNSYYLKNNELFFVYSTREEDINFVEPEGYTDTVPVPHWQMVPQNTRHSEVRYYFHNKNCIRYLKKEVVTDAGENPDMSSIQNKVETPPANCYKNEFSYIKTLCIDEGIWETE